MTVTTTYQASSLDDIADELERRRGQLLDTVERVETRTARRALRAEAEGLRAAIRMLRSTTLVLPTDVISGYTPGDDVPRLWPADVKWEPFEHGPQCMEPHSGGPCNVWLEASTVLVAIEEAIAAAKKEAVDEIIRSANRSGM